MREYLDQITSILNRIEDEDPAALAVASDAVADVICGDGLVYVFGCGHSHPQNTCLLDALTIFQI